MFIENYRRLVLRRGDLHHVACWIRSSSPGLRSSCNWENYYLGCLAVKDRAKLRDHPLDPYHVVSDFWVAHSEVVLIDLI